MRNFSNFGLTDAEDNVVVHEWGQNAQSVYLSLIEKLKPLKVGASVLIKTSKKLGSKNVIKFLLEKGLDAKVIGKGDNHLRVIEVIKSKGIRPVDLSETTVDKFVDFTFNDKIYKVCVGNSRFSKTSLDIGTNYLLTKLLENKLDLRNFYVADLGAGWGAIPLVLSREFANVKIVGFENDISSIYAFRKNFETDDNVAQCLKVDLCLDNNVPLLEFEGKFDFMISNPPFHMTVEERNLFFSNAKLLLKLNGEFFFCVKKGFLSRFRVSAQKCFMILDEMTEENWTVLRCKRVK
jgi:16S rRNA G1207 methylase RsmC